MSLKSLNVLIPFIELSTNLCEYDDEVFDEQQNTYNQIYDQWLKIV